MLHITATIAIPDNELSFSFIRASGPGGQNVNKVASAVQLRFDLQHSDALPSEVKARLRALAGKRVTDAGILIITSRRYRTQERNRQEALRRLTALVLKALEKPKPRKKSRPSRHAIEKRLKEKRVRSTKKAQRRSARDLPE